MVLVEFNAPVNLRMASEISPHARIKSSTFQFEVDYLKIKDIPTGESIFLPTFTAGGYDWALKLYPNGKNPEDKDYVSLFLVLRTDAKDITAEFNFQILPKMETILPLSSPILHTFTGYNTGYGYADLITKDEIEKLHNGTDVIVISCDIKVITEPRVIKNYPGGLREHMEKLREKGERFDVTFEVEGELISAHRLIMAARSPVFEAKLFGPMAEAKMECIKIDEMKAQVFKALVHFIYTDQFLISEPGDDKALSNELLQELFVAADRYALQKLTLLCEEHLSKNLTVDTVVTTLHLADRHSCSGLKRKCLKFASDPENFTRVARTQSYLHIMAGSPDLFAELCEKVEFSSQSAKKQRTA